jgi:rod shape-determining protein MreD
MRWVRFIITLLLAVVLQSTVVSWIRIHRVGPDLVFLIAIYYLLKAPPAEALLAAWAAGLALDLFGEARLGTFALSFGLVGLAVVRLRELVFRDHPLAQLFLVLIACQAVQVLARSLTVLVEPTVRWGIADVFLGAFYTALYTAVLAPYMLWLLGRLQNVLGLRPPDRLRARRRR